MQLLKIEDLIGETTEYDKKQAVELKRPKSWCKSVSAFANTTGGALIFGIADDDSIIGLKHAEEDSEKISEIIKNRIMPLPDFNMQFYKTADGKKLIILHIHKGEETPYYYSADGTTEAYIRVGNESVPAKATDLKRLVLRGRNSSFDSLDTAYHASDYSFSKLRERYKIWTGKSFPEGALISWGIQNEKGDLTNAGALLADEIANPVFKSILHQMEWQNKERRRGGCIRSPRVQRKCYQPSEQRRSVYQSEFKNDMEEDR
jgi:ATP-dependent DNA helicase RecG